MIQEQATAAEMLVVVRGGLSTKEGDSGSVGFAIQIKSRGFVSASGEAFSALKHQGIENFFGGIAVSRL